MLTQQTLDKLYDMKLTAMAEAFSQQMGQPDLGELSFEDRLAILDRLVHNAHKINLKGESMRKIQSSLTKPDNSGK